MKENMSEDSNYRRYVDHDIHTHTHLSLCCHEAGIADTYIKDAEKRGLRILGFSDHMWDNKINYPLTDFYKAQDYEHIIQIKSEISEKTDKLKILIGAETEFCMADTLGISESCAEKLDFVLVPHSHTHMLDFVMPKEYDNNIEKHSDYLVKSFMALCRHPMRRYITAIAHPFVPICKKSDYCERIYEAISDHTFTECFDAARDANIGIEINTSWCRKLTHDQIAASGYMRVLKLAAKSGCKFSLGSDAHGLSELGTIEKAADIMQIIGITDRDFISLVK